MPAKNPQLAALVDEIAAASARVRALAPSTDDAGFSRAPSPGAWSAAECVEHLSITTRAFLPPMDAALANGPADRVPDDHRYRRDPIGWLLCWFLEPPFRMKTKTPPAFVPDDARARPRAEIVDEFLALQGELAARVAAAANRDLGRLRVVSPFDSHVRYNLYSAFRAALAHERRHLWQAERALAASADSARAGDSSHP